MEFGKKIKFNSLMSSKMCHVHLNYVLPNGNRQKLSSKHYFIRKCSVTEIKNISQEILWVSEFLCWVLYGLPPAPGH